MTHPCEYLTHLLDTSLAPHVVVVVHVDCHFAPPIVRISSYDLKLCARLMEIAVYLLKGLQALLRYYQTYVVLHEGNGQGKYRFLWYR
jgi:hypothetical protein